MMFFNRGKHKRKLIVLGVVALIVVVAVISITLLLKTRKPETTPVYQIAPVDIGEPTQQPQSDIVCEYTDVLLKDISEPEPGDDIQDVIGHQNNKVGMYIYAEVGEFADLAAEMVNSNGGDWGYVLVPYNVKDRDQNRWGKLFEKLSEKRLIPIIQLWDLDLEHADKMDEQIKDSAKFLDSLKWPIRNRYISVYNEPNDAKFWKGKIDPEGYAKVLDETIKTLKEQNGEFFVMNGAFNSSARTGGDYLDAAVFMQEMNAEVPGIFGKLDGWASHPYPQPNFSGSPRATGRDSIKAYEWELNLLKTRFGVDISNLPVFITETGWAHKESEAHENGEAVQYSLNQDQVAENFKYAFEKVWLPDDRVVAVAPFTIRYNPPHDHFSWVNQDNEPYPQFDAVKSVSKKQGKPPVVNYRMSKVVACE